MRHRLGTYALALSDWPTACWYEISPSHGTRGAGACICWRIANMLPEFRRSTLLFLRRLRLLSSDRHSSALAWGLNN